LQLPDYRVERPSGAQALVVARGGGVAQRLRKALEAIGGLTHYVKPGDIVLIKPNAAFDRSPLLGATTNPEVLEQLVRMLLEDCRAEEVRVTDNPIESPAACFAKSGIGAAVARAGGRVLLPDGNAFATVTTPGAEVLQQWSLLLRPLHNVDKVIGVAPAKDHNLCHASLGIKNWYGLLGGRRNQLHQDIHAAVSDLALVVRPTLTIVDGSAVLMRNGPTGGNPADVKHGDALAVGTDPVALDAWAYEQLLERGPQLPGYLYEAERKGAGSVAYADRMREVL